MKLENSRIEPSGDESLHVSVRVRPFLKSELGKGDILFVDPLDDRKIKIGRDNNYYEGYYNKVLGVNSTQSELFQFVENCVPDVLNGINCTIFAYGQTGSGKTYTMFGSDWTQHEKVEGGSSRTDVKKKLDKNGNIL